MRRMLLPLRRKSAVGHHFWQYVIRGKTGTIDIDGAERFELYRDGGRHL